MLIFVAAESTWSARRRHRVYNLLDSLALGCSTNSSCTSRRCHRWVVRGQAAQHAHRVHHGSNSLYIDRGPTPGCYGVTIGFVGHNPFVIKLAPLWKYLRGNWKREREIAAARVRSRLGHRTNPPYWIDLHPSTFDGGSNRTISQWDLRHTARRHRKIDKS